MGTQALAFVGLLDRLAEDLGVSVATAGQLVPFYAVTFALAAPLTGALVARLERRGVLVAALAGVALVNLAAAFAPGFAALAGLRVIAGLLATLTVPIAAATAASLAEPEARGRAMSVVLGGVTVALVAGLPLGSLVGELFGWRACFLLSAAVTGAGALAIAALLPRAPSDDRPGLGMIAVGLRPPILLHLLVTFASLTAAFCINTYIAPIVSSVTGFDGAGVGAMQACAGLGAILGVTFGGRNADAEAPERACLRAYWVLIASLLGLAALMAATRSGPAGPGGAAALGLLLFLNGASMFWIMPTIQRRLAERAVHARNVVLALNGSMVFLGQAMGGALGGLAIGRAGLPVTALAGAGAGAAAAALILLVAAARSRARADAASSTPA